jgi:hypothetical protein
MFSRGVCDVVDCFFVIDDKNNFPQFLQTKSNNNKGNNFILPKNGNLTLKTGFVISLSSPLVMTEVHVTVDHEDGNVPVCTLCQKAIKANELDFYYYGACSAYGDNDETHRHVKCVYKLAKETDCLYLTCSSAKGDRMYPTKRVIGGIVGDIVGDKVGTWTKYTVK